MRVPIQYPEADFWMSVRTPGMRNRAHPAKLGRQKRDHALASISLTGSFDWWVYKDSNLGPAD